MTIENCENLGLYNQDVALYYCDGRKCPHGSRRLIDDEYFCLDAGMIRTDYENTAEMKIDRGVDY